jgi:hypothetical protein
MQEVAMNLPPPRMPSDPEILAYRSSSPVPGDVAARIAHDVIGAEAPRPPSRAFAPAPRFLFGEILSDQTGGPAYPDVLRVLCRLGRLARDHRIEFELQLGTVLGRVSIGGLDEGARAILARARTPAIAAMPLRSTRTRRVASNRKRSRSVRVA